MALRGALIALALGFAGMAGAQTIDSSLRPLANPRLAGAEVAATVPVPEAAPVLRPMRRPVGLVPIAEATAEVPRPMRRPAALAERIASLKAGAGEAGLDLTPPEPEAEVDLAAVPPLTAREKRRKRREAASMAGAVCGVPAIKGEEIPPIQSRVQGCGVEEAVRVTSVSGVQLSQAATVDCSVAQALNTWVGEVAQPAFKGRLTELRIAAHYVCRGRNNVKGAKISEHGKGRAIDISAFVLADGTVLTVSDNFNKTLRRIYKAACGIFKTTLGPGSDGYHEDHFHFDTAVRNSAYCR